ncbi:5032_t:CDS:2 [Funneliformis caledonium]|uniref:5032_t:CDS:1 n=1 Tax=Funneliformis caledonium TaxID=1117310 RepID=A0A9N9GYE7_9GLOM|nr:5032_t:CDS:2 [Funneliformis caledonium]
MRGSFEYKRPCGWKRIALNVLDKYENNLWLGVGGNRRSHSTNSVTNEWPVSYHGTAEHNFKSIAQDGYLLCKGKRFRFGRGIYSTPDIDVASRYATKYTFNGEQYLVVFQNRVNPNNLVRISKSETGIGEYWISPDGADLRPYGLCIKKAIDQIEKDLKIAKEESHKDGSDLDVLEIDLPSIKTKKQVHSSLMISIKQQLPNWWIQIDNKLVVNGNEFRPDVGGWNP